MVYYIAGLKNLSLLYTNNQIFAMPGCCCCN